MNVCFPNLVKYRDIYFTKFFQRKSYIDYFIDCILLFKKAFLKMKYVYVHVSSIFMQQNFENSSLMIFTQLSCKSTNIIKKYL